MPDTVLSSGDKTVNKTKHDSIFLERLYSSGGVLTIIHSLNSANRIIMQTHGKIKLEGNALRTRYPMA